MSIRKSQYSMAGAANEKALEALWWQHSFWWLAHYQGNVTAQKKAEVASEAAKKVLVAGGVPRLLIEEWERDWDEWFEKKLKHHAR